MLNDDPRDVGDQESGLSGLKKARHVAPITQNTDASSRNVHGA